MDSIVFFSILIIAIVVGIKKFKKHELVFQLIEIREQESEEQENILDVQR